MRPFHFARTMFFGLLAAELTVCLSATDGFAQTQDRRQMQTAPRTGRPSPPPSPRIVTPPAGRSVTPPSRRVVIPRGTNTPPGMHAPAIRRNRDVNLPTDSRARRSQRTITPRAITKRPDKSSTPVFFKRQTIRKPPVNVAIVNRGLRRNPGDNKPANIQHNPKHQADKAGWMHRHRPFFFKHAGHRWRRHYYTFLAGGLWYWFWYDVEADDDPAVLVYSDAALPDCDPEMDECVEPEVIAPAILEGRATEEAMADCAAEFRSFDARTGTYIPRQGEVRVCPYLE